jgi:predicted RNA-binding Zn-ribbon protein involved in translation (DUF1610 family)
MTRVRIDEACPNCKAYVAAPERALTLEECPGCGEVLRSERTNVVEWRWQRERKIVRIK